MSDESYDNLLIVIGASAGGLTPIRQIVRRFPPEMQAAVVIATHRDPAHSRNQLADILKHDATMSVMEPVEGEHIHCTAIYVGRPAESIHISGNHLNLEPITNSAMRSQRIDELFESAAESAGHNAIGVILSGCLCDGVNGLKAIRAAGGTCIVQDPQDATWTSMPETALREVNVDFVGDTDEIANRLISLAADRRCR